MLFMLIVYQRAYRRVSCASNMIFTSVIFYLFLHRPERKMKATLVEDNKSKSHRTRKSTEKNWELVPPDGGK